MNGSRQDQRRTSSQRTADLNQQEVGDAFEHPADALPNTAPPDRWPQLTRISDVQSREVEWLWPGRIGLRKLTCIAGDPGLGKSLISIDLAARVTQGSPWPDASGIAPKGGVVLMSAEDDLEDTIKPRLEAAGADCDRVFALQGVAYRDHAGKVAERAITLGDLETLESAIQKVPGCKLLVVDPVSCFLGDADSHKNAEVRKVLAPLADLAGTYGIAVVMISHLSKNATAAIYRTSGSLAFVAAARAVFAVVAAKDPERKVRLFLPIKNNLGGDKHGLAYVVETDEWTRRPQIGWIKGNIDISADEALGVNDGRRSSRKSDANPEEREQKRRENKEAQWKEKLLWSLDRQAPTHGVPVGYSDVRSVAGLNGATMAHACRLLEEEGTVIVTVEQIEMPRGGTKERKSIRRKVECSKDVGTVPERLTGAETVPTIPTCQDAESMLGQIPDEESDDCPETSASPVAAQNGPNIQTAIGDVGNVGISAPDGVPAKLSRHRKARRRN